jgi:hypothetical protein
MTTGPLVSKANGRNMSKIERKPERIGRGEFEEVTTVDVTLAFGSWRVFQ